MKKVFLFELKKLLIPLAIYLGIMSILAFVIILNSYQISWTSFTAMYSSFLIIMCFGVIYLVFSYNKKRISADMSYSLPVTKRSLFVGKYLASLTAIFSMAIFYLCICLIVFGFASMNELFDWSSKYQSIGNQLGNFVLGSLIQLLIILPLFNFFLLFYYKANTVLDGILFVGFGSLLVFLVVQIILEFADISVEAFPILVFINAPSMFLPIPRGYNYTFEFLTEFLIILLMYSILGYLLFIYLLWYSKKDCSVRTQNLCNGIFGYRVFLPMTGVLIPLIFISSTGEWGLNPLWFILLAIGLFIGYCISNRRVKFNKESYIVFASTLGFDFIFVIIWMATR